MVSRFRWWSLVLVFAVTATGATGQESETVKAFTKHWSAAEKAAAEQDFREAAARYADVAALFPFEPTARYRLATSLARLGEADRALTALKVAIEYGWADADALDRAEDWKPLRGDARFTKLAKATAACRDETIVVYAGDKVGRDRPAPLLVVLHGLGGGPRSEVPYWKPVADKLGMVLVAPRSGTRFAPMLHGWQRAKAKDSTAADYFDLDEATKRVDAAMDEASRLYNVDRGAVVLAGYSQGGGVALRLVADRPKRFRGAVAVCSMCQPLEKANWQKVAEREGVRVHLIAGEFDKLFGRSQSAAEVLKAAEVPYRFDTVEKSGHEYPADYADRLRSAAEFVLVGDSPKK